LPIKLCKLFWQGSVVDECKKLSFYFLRDLPPPSPPPRRRTLGPYAKGASPILYVSTIPWKYFFCRKLERSEEIKRKLFM
jgi:hypothetical protein